MQKIIKLTAFAICFVWLMSSEGEDNPLKGTYSERFFVPAIERMTLVEKAITGDKDAVRRLFLRYQMGSYQPEQAMFWAKVGKSLGETVTTEFLKAPPPQR